MRRTLHSLTGLLMIAMLWAARPASAAWGMPDPTTERGQVIHDIYVPVVIAATLVFLLVFVLLVWVLVRYREGSGHGEVSHEKHRGNIKAEVLWTVIPLIIVLWVGVISYVGLLELDEGYSDEEIGMVIDIQGSMYNWRAIYDGGFDNDGFAISSAPVQGIVADANVFHVPANVPIRFNITSMDILHAFAIMEESGLTLGMVDANPTGPTKYTQLDVKFAPGEYHVQCREHCFNPGHAYMRARIIAEPASDYEAWAEEQRLLGGAAGAERFTLEVTDGAMNSVQPNPAVIRGSRVILTIYNNGTDTTTVSSTGFDFTTTVAPGQMRLVGLDADTSGIQEITASTGGTVSFEVVEPIELEFTLDEWLVAPPTLNVDAGQAYLLKITNEGSSDHNLFIGDYRGAGDFDAPWQSVILAGGETGSLIFTPRESGTLDSWCNISGHYTLGMKGTITVA